MVVRAVGVADSGGNSSSGDSGSGDRDNGVTAVAGFSVKP